MIVPALLTNDKNELMQMFDVCSKFTDFVQIDIMDGKFVPSCSLDKDEIRGLKSRLRCEAHLMVNNPLEWLDAFKDFGAERIIFHFEIEDRKEYIIEEIRKKGFGVGLAINPSTSLDEFESLVNKVDLILFMSVVPGFYGSKFIPSVLDKIRNFRRIYPHKKTGIDGGVKLDNVRIIKNIGVDYVCVGSAILKATSPHKAYKKFLDIYSE